jgi:hypothetical protein
MFACVRDNLIINRVGVDCVHYLFNDADCREFIASQYPPDVLMAYDQLIPTAFKADLWRYCVLYKYGGAYLDVKLGFLPGVPPPCDGGCSVSSFNKGSDGVSDVSLRAIVERWLSSGGGSGGGVFVLERDAVGLWSPGRHGIHNAFIIVKPKNPILLECIFRIVSAAKEMRYARGGLDDDYSPGWMTRPLFVTGPGLLGDVWWESLGVPPPYDGVGVPPPYDGVGVPPPYDGVGVPPPYDGVGSSLGVPPPYDGVGSSLGVPPPYDDVLDASDCSSLSHHSYPTMFSHFRFFFEGNGVIGYYIGGDTYVKAFKVYDGYNEEYHHMMRHKNCVPHYTVLWSQGLVWRERERERERESGFRPPTTDCDSLC